jgi:hypothetical protein
MDGYLHIDKYSWLIVLNYLGVWDFWQWEWFNGTDDTGGNHDPYRVPCAQRYTCVYLDMDVWMDICIHICKYIYVFIVYEYVYE